VRRLSFYAELIWEARKKRAMATIRDARREMDWVVVRNRTGYTEARNQRRIDQALGELSKRVGFRIASGLSERVIYRELFPSGLTLLDKGHLGELGTSHRRATGTAHARCRAQSADARSNGQMAMTGVNDLRLAELALLGSVFVRLLTGQWPWDYWKNRDVRREERQARTLWALRPMPARRHHRRASQAAVARSPRQGRHQRSGLRGQCRTRPAARTAGPRKRA
jgi:hypothetical protein